MEKISLTIDLSLLDKSKFRKITKNVDGVAKEVSVADIEVVPSKEPKVVTKQDGTPVSGDTWELMKVGFITQKAEKLEDGTWEKTPILGDATAFRNKGTEPTKVDGTDVDYPQSDISPEDIPF